MGRDSFDLDLRDGQYNESLVAAIITAPPQRTFEVKSQQGAGRCRSFYVERECRLKDGAYHPSGIDITEAGYWVEVVGDSGAFIALPTALYREIVEQYARPSQHPSGANPTRGCVLRCEDLVRGILNACT